MKIPLPLLFLIAVPVLGVSQRMGKFYYNKNWELTSRDSAAYVRMSVYDTINNYFVGPVMDMYPSGKPQMKGTYKAAKKEGVFTFFYENGVVESSGNFENDVRTGPWKFYYPNNQLKAEVQFASSVKVISLFDETGKELVKNGTGDWHEEYTEFKVPGKITISGRLKNYEKHGDWICKLSNGDLLYTEEYKNGNFISGYTYPGGVKTRNNIPHGNNLVLPFKFIVTEAFGASPEIGFENYPFLDVLRRDGKSFYNEQNASATDSLHGGKEIYTEIEESASPKGGMAAMYADLFKEVRYPPDARRKGIQGTVFIEFLIEKDGTLTNFTIKKGLNPDCDAEVLRIFMKYGSLYKWNPGIQRGKPVRQRMVMPYTFKLG